MDILAINQPYLAQAGFKEVFAAAGHRCLSVGWHREGCDLICDRGLLTLTELYSLLPPDFVPERIIYFDRSEPIRVLGLEDSQIPTIGHFVDVHIHKPWHPIWAGVFDHSLVAMKGYMSLFEPGLYTPPTEWFPLWAFKVGPSADSIRDVPTSFRGTFAGTHPKRQDFFNQVKSRTLIDFGSGPFFDLYARSKIILNDCISDDLNWRVFEALASGAMLLTPRVSPETLELFPEGEALVTYEAHNVEDAVSKIDYYLNHDSERLRIARNGYERVCRHHTAQSRAQQLLNVVERVERRTRPRKLFSAALSYLRTASILSDFYRNEFLEAARSTIVQLSQDTSLSSHEHSEHQRVLERFMSNFRV